jgi:hypothetical protein
MAERMILGSDVNHSLLKADRLEQELGEAKLLIAEYRNGTAEILRSYRTLLDLIRTKNMRIVELERQVQLYETQRHLAESA